MYVGGTFLWFGPFIKWLKLSMFVIIYEPVTLLKEGSKKDGNEMRKKERGKEREGKEVGGKREKERGKVKNQFILILQET
jgi:hypothetical protein